MCQSLGCTFEELGERLSSEEYALRLHYFQQWGAPAQLKVQAQLLALTFNIHRNQDAEPMTLEDVLPGRFGPPPEAKPATGADAFAFIAALGE